MPVGKLYVNYASWWHVHCSSSHHPSMTRFFLCIWCAVTLRTCPVQLNNSGWAGYIVVNWHESRVCAFTNIVYKFLLTMHASVLELENLGGKRQPTTAIFAFLYNSPVILAQNGVKT